MISINHSTASFKSVGLLSRIFNDQTKRSAERLVSLFHFLAKSKSFLDIDIYGLGPVKFLLLLFSPAINIVGLIERCKHSPTIDGADVKSLKTRLWICAQIRLGSKLNHQLIEIAQ